MDKQVKTVSTQRRKISEERKRLKLVKVERSTKNSQVAEPASFGSGL